MLVGDAQSTRGVHNEPVLGGTQGPGCHLPRPLQQVGPLRLLSGTLKIPAHLSMSSVMSDELIKTVWLLLRLDNAAVVTHTGFDMAFGCNGRCL